jgi:hypothetical protein
LAGAALVGMPLLTAFSGFLAGYILQDSLSDYYFVVKDGGVPRTLFVMFLAFLGGVLFSYRGLDESDNRIHNVAGFFAFGVALFPLHCSISEHPCCEPGLLPVLHLPAAGLLYLSALISVLYGGGPKLKAALERLPNKQIWLTKLRNIKGLSSTLMTVGIITFLFHKLLKDYFPEFSWIFWIEYVGFFGFGIYWVRLMRLINAANKEGRRMITPRPEAPLSEDSEAPTDFRKLIKPAPQIEEWSDIP